MLPIIKTIGSKPEPEKMVDTKYGKVPESVIIAARAAGKRTAARVRPQMEEIIKRHFE